MIRTERRCAGWTASSRPLARIWHLSPPAQHRNYAMEIVTFKGRSSTPPPSVTSVSPNSGAQGQSLPSVVITGSSFQSGATCNFGAGITVNSCTFNSATQLTANISISSTATVGTRNVTVTIPTAKAAL